jgi:hypothetical protein
MNNSLLSQATTPPPAVHRRPMTAGGGSAQAGRSAERFTDLRRSLASLSDTVHQRTSVGTSAGDMQLALTPRSQHNHNRTRGGGAPPTDHSFAGTPSQSPVGPSGSSTALRSLAASRLASGPAGDPEHAWREVTETSVRLQQHVALEVRRRAEGQKALQQLVDARAKELANDLEKKVQERMISLHRNVDVLVRRVDVLNKELAVEREKNVRLTQELKYQASQGLTEVKASIEQERTQRVEKEAMLTRKLSEDVFRLQERLDVERHARDEMVAAVRGELAAASRQRHSADEQIVQKLLDDIKAVKLGIEREEREKGEEHLAAALNDVVRQVQSSLAALA